MDYGHYAEQIERYLELFPRERLHLVFLDDYRRDRRGVLARAWRFLGLDPGDPDAELPAAAKRGARYNSRAVFRLTNLVLRSGVQRLVPRAARRALSRLLRRLGSRPEMDGDTRALLIEHYRPHNRRLEALTGRDLSDWNR